MINAAFAVAETDAGEEDYIISPRCGFIQALREAYDRLDLQDSTKLAIRSIIKGIEQASQAIGLADKPVREIRRRNILALLDHCSKINPRWSNKRYNKYRAYQLMIFKELIQVEAVEFNPVRDILDTVAYKLICQEIIEEFKVTEKEKAKYIFKSVEKLDE